MKKLLIVGILFSIVWLWNPGYIFKPPYQEQKIKHILGTPTIKVKRLEIGDMCYLHPLDPCGAYYFAKVESVNPKLTGSPGLDIGDTRPTWTRFPWAVGVPPLIRAVLQDCYSSITGSYEESALLNTVLEQPDTYYSYMNRLHSDESQTESCTYFALVAYNPRTKHYVDIWYVRN